MREPTRPPTSSPATATSSSAPASAGTATGTATAPGTAAATATSVSVAPRRGSVTVEVAGQRFTLRTDADEGYVRSLAEFVSQKIQEQKSARTFSTQALAILAALNIADDLFQLRQRDQELREAVRERSRRILALLAASEAGAGAELLSDGVEADDGRLGGDDEDDDEDGGARVTLATTVPGHAAPARDDDAAEAAVGLSGHAVLRPVTDPGAGTGGDLGAEMLPLAGAHTPPSDDTAFGPADDRGDESAGLDVQTTLPLSVDRPLGLDRGATEPGVPGLGEHAPSASE